MERGPRSPRWLNTWHVMIYMARGDDTNSPNSWHEIVCGQLGHKAIRCLGLPPIPISKVSQFSAAEVTSGTQDQLLESTNTESVPEKTDAAFQSLKATETVPLGSKESTSFDSQGCILLDHEKNDLTTNDNSEIGEPRSEVTTVSSVSFVAVNTPKNSSTENVPVASTPNETSFITALDTDVFDEKEIPTSTVMAASSSEEIFEQVEISKPVDSSTHSLPQISDAPLGEVDNVVDNTFTSPTSVPFVHNNLFAVLDNAEASEPPAVSPAMELVFTNSPLPSSASAPHDTAPGQSRDFFVEELTQRSRGGRPLKPSQRLKDMEWFTVPVKGRRGRGKAPYH
ncbi:hypothetical protein DY000_02039182 [Brassica cretica]|uniref:Uncharacterized protein n=1 Tax=Brassica cretica TaxID=69181 RepID=A0ABQ7BRB8_BRACR|nr:hypothetical protein DY000_02039182 [Brassica cretica]